MSLAPIINPAPWGLIHGHSSEFRGAHLFWCSAHVLKRGSQFLDLGEIRTDFGTALQGSVLTALGLPWDIHGNQRNLEASFSNFGARFWIFGRNKIFEKLNSFHPGTGNF